MLILIPILIRARNWPSVIFVTSLGAKHQPSMTSMTSLEAGHKLPVTCMTSHSGSPPPFVKAGGANWIFELNEIWGELKFFKIMRGSKREGKVEFLKFSLRGGIAGDETSNRKQNFRMNFKMFS